MTYDAALAVLAISSLPASLLVIYVHSVKIHRTENAKSIFARQADAFLVMMSVFCAFWCCTAMIETSHITLSDNAHIYTLMQHIMNTFSDLQKALQIFVTGGFCFLMLYSLVHARQWYRIACWIYCPIVLISHFWNLTSLVQTAGARLPVISFLLDAILMTIFPLLAMRRAQRTTLFEHARYADKNSQTLPGAPLSAQIVRFKAAVRKAMDNLALF